MNIESHGSTGGPAHSNHEEEEEEAPKATTIKTVSCIKLGKHKGKLKQTSPFLIKRNGAVLCMM